MVSQVVPAVLRAAGDLDHAAPLRVAAQFVGQRPGGGRFADAAGAGEEEGVGIGGGGEGGEAADDGGLAVDVGEAGGDVRERKNTARGRKLVSSQGRFRGIIP